MRNKTAIFAQFLLFLTMGYSFAAPVTVAPPVVSKAVPKMVTVVDEKEQPVAGAIIAMGEIGGNGRDKLVSTFKADKGGRFPVPALSQDAKYGWLVAQGQGTSIGGTPLQRQNTLQRIVLRPFHAVRVRLVDGKNVPLSDGTVRLSSRYRTQNGKREYVAVPESDQKLPFPVEVRTDAQGWVTLPFGAKEDVLRLLVKKAGFQSITLRLNVPEDEALIVRLVPEAQMRGRILRGDTGQPFQNAELEFASSFRSSAKADAQGRFLLSGLDETRGNLLLKSEDWVLPLRRWDTKRGKTVEVGDLKATRGCLVKGIVRRSDKKPVQGALHILPAQPSQTLVRQSSKTIFLDGQGDFSLRLPPGRFELSVESWNNGHMSVQKSIEAKEGASLRLDMLLTVPPQRKRPSTTVRRAQRAAEPERAQYFFGDVMDAVTGEPVIDATVSIYANSEQLHSGVTNKKGRFALGPFPTTGQNLASIYVAVAWTKNGLSAPVLVPSTWDKAVKLTLGGEVPLKVRVVTTDGKPIRGASINATRVRLNDRESWLPLPQDKVRPQSDSEGLATVSGLPSDGFVELKLDHPEFAKGISVVALPRHGVAQLKLSRETIIRGRVTLGGTTPITLPKMQVKTQGWRYPWDDYYNRPISLINEDGTFEIRKVPSLEEIGDADLCINVEILALDIGQKKEVTPGVWASYVNGWNLMLTIEKDGKQERWISFVEADGKGLRYQEGEVINHDMTFQPMALLKGTLPKNSAKPRSRSISYRDPRSIYGSWQITPNNAGNFELPVPVGEVTVNFPGGARTFTGLKPHEVRAVDWKTQPNNPKTKATATTRRSTSQEFILRVLGPDGATVPRPPVTVNAQGGMVLSALPGAMDGSISIWSHGSRFNVIDVTSAYLDKPLRILPQSGQTTFTVRLDRLPTKTPADPMLRTVARTAVTVPRQSTPIQLPPPLAIGDKVPELQIERWIQGEPVSLEKLRGRVVVVTFADSPTVARLANHYSEAPVTFIRLLRNNGRDNEDGGTPSANTFLALDPTLPGDWRGSTARLLSIGYSGTAVVDGEGRLAATNLGEPFLSAKIEQLLETK